MKWLVGTDMLDCGDNSCRYAKVISGQRTNGGCRCIQKEPRTVERFLLMNYSAALGEMEALRKERDHLEGETGSP